jgi:hypothetical protein
MPELNVATFLCHLSPTGGSKRLDNVVTSHCVFIHMDDAWQWAASDRFTVSKKGQTLV